MNVIALVVGESEAAVGVDGVEAAILQRIGAELVRKADSAAFLAQIEQQSTARRADDAQRLLELRSAIAFQRAEYVAGQALAVQAHQRRFAARRTDHECDMLLAVVRRAKGHNL